MLNIASNALNGRILETRVSFEPSEDEDYNSVPNSDDEDNPPIHSARGFGMEMVQYTPLPADKSYPEMEENKITSEQGNVKPVETCNPTKIDSELTSFVQKKSFAQNMMDIALLSANTNQLRYVIDLGERHPYYMTSMTLIVVSLFMQVVVGLSMLYMNSFNMKKKSEIRAASALNNLAVTGVFLVTLINVFISTFNGAGADTSPAAAIGNTSNVAGAL